VEWGFNETLELAAFRFGAVLREAAQIAIY
jgi:hypothetical protein